MPSTRYDVHIIVLCERNPKSLSVLVSCTDLIWNIPKIKKNVLNNKVHPFLRHSLNKIVF